MQTSPSVVAIIPCYNAGSFIARTVQSVIAQDYPRLRIIVVDDGSTDNSLGELERFGNAIEILQHPGHANCGQAASLDLGIAQSDADLIAFLDADDLWYPGKLAKQVQVLQAHPECGLVYCNGQVIDADDRPLYPILEADFVAPPNPEGILMNCYIRTPSMVMVRRGVMVQAGPFARDMQSIDHDMWVRVGELTPFQFLNESLTGYRQHAGQQSLRRRQWEDGFRILANACGRYPYSRRTRRHRKAVIYYRLGEYDLRVGHYAAAAGEFGLAFLHDPLRAIKQVLQLQA